MRPQPRRSRLSTALRTIFLPSILAAMLLSGGQNALGAPESITPRLSVNIPNVRFEDIVKNSLPGSGPRSASTVDIPWISNYVTGVYRYAVSIAGIIAGVMFVMGAFSYLTAGGDASRVAKGKERITNAIIGLFLVLGAYVLLLTINPDLVHITSLRVRMVEKKTFTAEEREDYGDSSTPPTGGATGAPVAAAGGAPATAVCRTIETCRTMCNGTRPTSTPGVMDASLARPIPSMPGLVGGSHTASQAVIDGLTRAAADANTRGYTIIVTSGYRPLATQIALVCARMGDPAREAGIGSAVAWPGGSNHGAGFAVDLQLRRNSDRRIVVGSGNCAAQTAGTLATAADSQLFDQIMTSAGARRYSNEIWHYEFGSSSGCRCTFPNCPPPPKPCSGC